MGNESNDFGFTGNETDAEGGLVYAQARFYDPEIGRFLSHDPVEGDPNNPPSLHRYLYVYGMPTTGVDPDGRERRVVEPDPEDGAAQRIKERYEKAYENFKRTPLGADAAKRLESDPNFTLTIVLDSEYKRGLVVEEYHYEDDGAIRAGLP